MRNFSLAIGVMAIASAFWLIEDADVIVRLMVVAAGLVFAAYGLMGRRRQR